MRNTKRLAMIGFGFTLAALAVDPALAKKAKAAAKATDVAVELLDKSSGAGTDMVMKVNVATVKAGRIHFHVVNTSLDTTHEMLVLATDLTVDAFPYDTAKDVAIEAKMKSLGEVAELAPTKSGDLTVTLKPGTYVLSCNQPGHLHKGMWAKLVVTAS